MPIVERSAMAQTLEFVALASREGANVTALCARFGMARSTGCELRRRWRAAGEAGLAPRSRRPLASPGRTPGAVEEAILALRAAHPAWGARKLAAALARGGVAAPAPSTVHAVRLRRGALAPDPAAPRRWQRFEREEPNAPWQLDFVGHKALAPGAGRVHPLALLDDHSRFALALVACPDERRETVRPSPEAAFRQYGLPGAILADNGPPWGTSGAGGVTALEAWLRSLGVRLRHGRADHPQTQGTVERFHRTVAAEAFGPAPFPDLAAAQRAFDRFRDDHNRRRPHAALDLAVPAVHYRVSPRPFPDRVPEQEFGPDDAVRVVRRHGVVSFRNRPLFVGRGLAGERVALRPTEADGVLAVYFFGTRIGVVAPRDGAGIVRDVPEHPSGISPV
jgi:transposase InsO family protein